MDALEHILEYSGDLSRIKVFIGFYIKEQLLLKVLGVPKIVLRLCGCCGGAVGSVILVF